MTCSVVVAVIVVVAFSSSPRPFTGSKLLEKIHIDNMCTKRGKDLILDHQT